MGHRIHIVGASGTGATTLGAALAERRDCPQFDTDSYFWDVTDPPYQRARPTADRLERLLHDLTAHPAWVLSGSLCGWGDPAIPRFELVVFLRVPTALRLDRLRTRERTRYGAQSLEPGGAMYTQHRDFLAWAAEYDEGGLNMRSLARHEQWLAGLPCPVLRLEGDLAVGTRVARVLAMLERAPEPDARELKSRGG